MNNHQMKNVANGISTGIFIYNVSCVVKEQKKISDFVVETLAIEGIKHLMFR